MSYESHNVLIGVTGSVATIKLIELIEELKSALFCANLHIKVIQTQSSKHFVSKDEVRKKFDENHDAVEMLDDEDEWSSWNKIGDPVLHVQLRDWAHLLVIAPLSANTMAKMANGFCDNLLTCVVRAWNMSKTLIYCPAMNTHMHNHPLTLRHMSELDSFGYLRMDSIEKRLACGDVGIGAMATVGTIAKKVVECLSRDAE